MSPRELSPPVGRASRVAVVVYVVCGVVGVAGLFAAVNDVAVHEEDAVVVDEAVADVDARLFVGVWRSGADVVVFDAAGHGTRCLGGAPSRFDWHVVGNEVRDDAGNLLGVRVGNALQVGALTLVQTGGGAL